MSVGNAEPFAADQGAGGWPGGAATVFVSRFVSDPVVLAAETGTPGGQYSTIFDIDDLGAQPLLDLRPVGGLVLLGEAGMGKSEALVRLVRHWVAEGLAATHPVIVDLEIVTGDSSFATHVAGALRARLVQRAAGETLPVVCVLDNVDRCGLAPKALGGALAALLADVGERGVCVLMACRTAQWPTDSKALTSLPVELEVRHLLEFRREQVAELARALGIDADAFLGEVDRAGAMPLACIPLTARMLVGEFASARALPADPVELYEAGLTRLAGEWDEDWAARRTHGARVVPAALRMDMGAQIAAWILLCARASVLVSDAHSDPTDLRVTEVAAGPEASIGDRHDEIALLRDTLDCAVFTSRGRYRRSLRHPSFAAYLAARYLANSALDPDQLRSVLVGPRDAGARVYPLLREVAAWLVARDPDRFDWLMRADAETVVSYPYALARGQLRARLVDAVLALAGRESLRSGAVTAFALDRLEHPGLEQQLREAMARGPAGRVRAAIEIAMATGKVGLVDRIAAIAGDRAVDEWVRTRAVQVAAELEPGTAREPLRQVLLAVGAEDLPDEVRGALLDALWPDALDPAELVASLTTPRSPLVFGLYALFLYRLPERLTDADMPDVLLSVARGRGSPVPGQWQRRSSKDLASRLISRAWMAADRRPLLTALASLVRSLILEDWHTKWPARLGDTEADTRDRHTLLELMLHQAQGLPEIDKMAFSPVSMHLGLLRAEDLGWLRGRASTTTGDIAARWQKLITWLSAARLPAAHEPEPAEVLTAQPQPGRDDPSDTDTGDTETHAGRGELLRELVRLLAAAEDDEPDAFWQLCQCLQLAVLNRSGFSQYVRGVHDVSDLTGWQLLAGSEPLAEQRFARAAELFLLRQDPLTDVWIDRPNTRSAIAQAGYLAFAYFARVGPERLERLDAAMWRRWAAALIGHDTPATVPPTRDVSAAWEIRIWLVTQLERRAPAAAAQPAARMVRAAGAQGAIPEGIACWHACWSDELAAALTEQVDALAESPVSFATRSAVEALLLRNGHQQTRTRICTLINEAADGERGDEAVHAATILLRSTLDNPWTVVLPVMHTAPAWGLCLIHRLSLGEDSETILAKLTDRQVADLFRWFLQHLPPEDDSWEGMPNPSSRRRDLEFWRDRMLRHLATRAETSVAAMRHLQALADEHPQRPWLRRPLTQAQEALLGATPSMLRPAELHALVGAPARRIVRDSADLCDLILAELEDLQQAMKDGMPPQATFLWDEQRLSKEVSRWQPKREPDLSDYIARHLKDRLERRGVFTDREVEVGRTDPKALGRRIDLLCQVSVRQGHNPVHAPCRVVIEVKCPWNDQLDTGIRNQLASYMTSAGTDRGIYLVGWYLRSQWDNGDWRYKKTRSGDTLEQLTARLDRLTAEESARSGTRIRPFILNLQRPERPTEHEERSPA